MERKNKRSVEADLRTLSCLKDIYELTKDNWAVFSLDEMIVKHKMGKNKQALLSKNKIILKRKISGGLRNTFEYKWNTIRPNIKMAEKINDIEYQYWNSLKTNKTDLFNQPRIVEVNKTIQEEKVTTPKKGTHREKKVVEVKQQKEFSLFWGLIKIKY